MLHLPSPALLTALLILVLTYTTTAAPKPELITVYTTIYTRHIFTQYVDAAGNPVPAPSTKAAPSTTKPPTASVTTYCGSRGQKACPVGSSCSLYPHSVIQDAGGVCVATKGS